MFGFIALQYFFETTDALIFDAIVKSNMATFIGGLSVFII